MQVTEFHELVKEAPNFNAMGHAELVAYAYGMYAAGVKMDAENAKLRELIKDLYEDMWASGEWIEPYEQRMRELGVEVD